MEGAGLNSVEAEVIQSCLDGVDVAYAGDMAGFRKRVLEALKDVLPGCSIDKGRKPVPQGVVASLAHSLGTEEKVSVRISRTGDEYTAHFRKEKQ